MKQFLVGINLNSNELQNARIHNVEALPISAVPGQVAFNTNNNDNKLYVYNGSSWITWAPINHASTSSTFGQATDGNFGHVKLTDTFPYSDDGTASTGGVAVTPTALAAAYNTFASTVSPTMLPTEQFPNTNQSSIPTIGAIINSSAGIIPYLYAQTVTSSISSDVNTSSYLTTQSAVYTFVKAELADLDAMRFMGVVNTSNALPSANVRPGDTYRATSAFELSSASTVSPTGEVVESGDLIIATSSAPLWTVAQTNIEGAITSIKGGTYINAARQGVYTVSVDLIDRGITAGTYGSTGLVSPIPATALTPTWGEAFEFPVVGLTRAGVLSSASQTTVVIPSTVAGPITTGLMTSTAYNRLMSTFLYKRAILMSISTHVTVPYHVLGYHAIMGRADTQQFIASGQEVILDCTRTSSGTTFSVAQQASLPINIYYYITTTESISSDNTH